MVENFVSFWTLYTKLHPHFHSLCILELHGKEVTI